MSRFFEDLFVGGWLQIWTSAVTLFFSGLFVGMVIWIFKKNNRKRYEQISRMPLDEDH